MSLWWGCSVLDWVLFLSPAFCWRKSFDTGRRWKPKSLCCILYILSLMKADGALPWHLIGAIEAAAHAMVSFMFFTSTVLPYNYQLKQCPTIKNKEITQGESYRLTHTELVCLPTTRPGLRESGKQESSFLLKWTVAVLEQHNFIDQIGHILRCNRLSKF